jgi:P27 family predicted phage terminase small subunit
MGGGKRVSKVKPVDLKTGGITKDEYNKRKSAEDKLKGSKQISKTPPKDLCKKGKVIYKEIVNSLPDEFLNNTDIYTVSIVADAVANMQKCREIINEQGLLVEYTNNSGATNIDQNKAILVYQKYADIYNKFSGELGLSPSARSKLALILSDSKEKEMDPLLRVLSGGKG